MASPSASFADDESQHDHKRQRSDVIGALPLVLVIGDESQQQQEEEQEVLEVEAVLDEPTVPTEHGDLALFLSAKSASGYLGVTRKTRGSGRFEVVGPGPDRRQLGTYDCPVSAAYAYAFFMLQVHGKRADEDAVKLEGMVKVADGFELALSPDSSTGYLGVSHRTGKSPPFQAEASHGGVRYRLGSFHDALSAAVAVAKFRQSGPSADQKAKAEPTPTSQETAGPQPRTRGRGAPPPPPPPPPPRGMPAVAALLEHMDFAQYARAFEEHGYDCLPFLASLDESELGVVAELVQMKPGHAHRFKRWFPAEAARALVA